MLRNTSGFEIDFSRKRIAVFDAEAGREEERGD